MSDDRLLQMVSQDNSSLVENQLPQLMQQNMHVEHKLALLMLNLMKEQSYLLVLNMKLSVSTNLKKELLIMMFVQ